MNEQEFDVAVIGGGPGGYPAAIKAAQLGANVALIEAKDLGGTCLNRGCIPSKSLIASAELLKRIREAEEFGIQVKDISFDYGAMVDSKDTVVSNIRKGLEGLILSNQVKLIRGYGKLTSPSTIKVSGADNLIIRAKKIVLATASEPRNMGAFPFDYKQIHDSTSLLELKKLPKSIVIVGGGVIGCEFASLYSEFGVTVTVVEMMSSLLPLESKSVSAYLTKCFEKKGIKVHVNAKVEAIEKN